MKISIKTCVCVFFKLHPPQTVLTEQLQHYVNAVEPVYIFLRQ